MAESLNTPDSWARADAFDADWSLEVAPTDGDIDPALHDVREGTDIYVASIPGRGVQNVIAVSAKLRAIKLEPIPHLSARGMESWKALDDLLARLRGGADVRSVMLLGGDISTTKAGPFLSSRSLLETDLFCRHGIERVGFATYPEQHPLIERSILEEELGAKIQLAAKQGLESWLVSQFCFDPDTVVRHADYLRAKGIDAPLHVGIAGPTSWKGMARFAKICGVAASARSVLTNSSRFSPLLLGFEPSDIVDRLSELASSRPELRIVGPHYFTFGGLVKTVDWLNARESTRGII